MSEIDDFLAGYEDVGDVEQALRRFVKENVPDCTETLHSGWKVISYGGKTKFCAIAPHKRWVNLQFHQGATLPDPSGRMTGTGKSIRHIKVAQTDDMDADLADVIRLAAGVAHGD